jgi:cyclic beta-1,2-glucan synthetase
LKNLIVHLFRRPSPAFVSDAEEPIRAELFGIERLEQHAESLAVAQGITKRPATKKRLADRLADNGGVLHAAYRAIAMAIRNERAITPAADWLVDNFHAVEEQILDIVDDLPRGYYRQLPKLAEGPLKGYPRVYGVAWAFVAHTDSRFEGEMLCRFVRAYQRVQPLTIGELWAVPITLRIVLVENLRRCAERIVKSGIARQEADALADRILNSARAQSDTFHAALRGVGQNRLATAFAVQLVQRLREQDPIATPALRWLDERLALQGTSADEIVQEEHRRQGAVNVTVRNVITSMRLISAADWQELFESISPVDQALRAKSNFAEMDFPTRDSYRRAIEELARGSSASELEIVDFAIAAADRAQCDHVGCDQARASRKQDPGYYLISEGRKQTEKQIGFRAPVKDWLIRASLAAGLSGYLATIAMFSSLAIALPLFIIATLGVGGPTLIFFALMAALPALEIAVAVSNRQFTSWIPVHSLPALELRKGVPLELRTMVVVPTMLTTHEDLEVQIERLEVHYLASEGGDLYFALLSDWADSPTESLEGDDELLAAASRAVARLNSIHARGGDGARFFLLHRRRLWNEREGKWMGWERKRGKLHELNQLLRGARGTSFVTGVGAPAVPSNVRYVITLDADTRLPRGTAERLIGKMAHPLNRPLLDPGSLRVVDGHALMQPRVTPALPTDQNGSIYQRVFSGPSGIDPYAFAASDVYQDLLDEGSYSGKGIYDIDAFEAALAGRVPENTLLSHDLFEGIFARAGLAADIAVVEEFPSRYDVAAAREHRWARGDWQLLPWVFGFHQGAGDSRSASIPLIGRWKMIDNLRRSISAPAAFLALIAGWTLPLRAAGVWTAFVLLSIAIPALLPIFAGVLPRRPNISVQNHWRAVGSDLQLAFSQSALRIIFLAHQAWLMADAVARTLVRMLVTQRRMLEWITAAQASLRSRLDLLEFYRRLAGALALALSAAVIVAYVGHSSWPVAGPFIVLWLLSPAVARWVSLPLATEDANSISATDARALRLIARQTWRFFETFVTAEDHMLPPDNFQEDPELVIAHRTSPTNIGLYLLSVIGARDLGWIGTVEAFERLEATLTTISGLERFRGHFYNWYDTRDLHPLEPRYVSSVDSGNLAGHLIAVTNACREMLDAPVVVQGWLSGIEDTLKLSCEATRALEERRGDTISRKDLEAALDALGESLSSIRQGPLADREALPATLNKLSLEADTVGDVARTLAAERGGSALEGVLVWVDAIKSTIRSHQIDVEHLACPARSLAGRLQSVIELTGRMFSAMDFGFLYNTSRQLLSIGYRVTEGCLDENCYDLLASEARLASLVAIAKGDLPVKHWFRLGREMTLIHGGSALISWSGSMFEYLMPLLVMHEPTGSVLENTTRLVVRRQMEYGRELGVPWGVSESAFNARDLNFTYQYSGFGVPGLGLKRGLSQDIVISAYATGLATMIDAGAAVRNFSQIATVGGRGRYGWYEALDYTPLRIPESETVAIVRTYMAHHQGMTLIAIGNVLCHGATRARFHAEPIIQATELLLQERIPRDAPMAFPRAEEFADAAKTRGSAAPIVRRFHSPHDSIPRTHLLSNGRYVVMMTAAGSGYSHWRDLAVTRWQEDVTRDSSGSYVFLRDVSSGKVWSAGYQPTCIEPDSYEVAFSEDRAEIIRQDGTITTRLEVAVSPEYDAEVRRLSITNLGTRPREIEITSYAEVVLALPAADNAHLAFSKLFIQTEFVAEAGALLATRRLSSPAESPIWAAHLSVVEGDSLGDLQFETDRARFLGQGCVIRKPVSVVEGRPLSNTVGDVLDPIFSLRIRVRIAPGATARVAFWTLIAPSRSDALDLADKHQDASAFERAATRAWTQAQVQLLHLSVGPEEAHLFQRLANHVLYSDPTLRTPSEALKGCESPQSTLWPYSISGDLPIVLVRTDEIEDLEIVKQLVRAHEYWRMKLLAVDLVILNERPSSYLENLQTALETMVRSNQSRTPSAGEYIRGAVFVLQAGLLSVEARNLLQSAARVVLFSRRGSLSEQLKRLEETKPLPAPSRPQVPSKENAIEPPLSIRSKLEFFNGLGGFTVDGREYVTVLSERQWTPAPWINVIANPAFGFQVSAVGSGYTWSINSRENQLTQWSNDPVSDSPGEVFYVRDEDSGELWGPTALPIREQSPYVARHGQGYSRFEHSAHSIDLELEQFVALEDPIKISRLKIRNRTGRIRRLSITAYVEWVLGTQRGASAPFVVTEIDSPSGALLARNSWSRDFGRRTAFLDLAGQQLSCSGDRGEFLGRNRGLEDPAALAEGKRLSNRAGAGLDPCGALQTRLELKPHAVAEVVCFLGQAETKPEALSLIARYRTTDLDSVFNAVIRYWDDVLGAVQVTTPDRSMDLLLNRWLLYQTLACRLWARSAFYQASGAYGFRDQLQDAMALTVSKPELAREHLLRAAARQFAEGDVQHWWLPPSGHGIRTRVSDDRIWLPYVATHYVAVTGDGGILDEKVPYLDGPLIHAGESESFFQPMVSENRDSLFEHCARAIDTSLSVGDHGLPLIRTGDWNDGMNRVGELGKGESIWLGWFLIASISALSEVAIARGDHVRASTWQKHAASVRESLERAGWDGRWYRRGYFDDGTPLGSNANAECRIDSIAQAWAVISGAADPVRAAASMAAVQQNLVRPDHKMMLLFAPPFDYALPDPGYIKGYPRGVRENGGQYTHAAVWSLIASAMLDDGDQAYERFSFLNPINHSSRRADIHRYKVEPYVMSADVYSNPQHLGRGGWTWYTGSAGWMYRAGLEWILGIRLRGAMLHVDPCIPKSWPRFEIVFRYRSAFYEIKVENPRGVGRGVSQLILDGVTLPRGQPQVPLVDDGNKHQVRVTVG